MAVRTNIIALFFLLTISLNEGLRILVFIPMPFKSHSILGNAIVRNLLEAGHEVVHVTSFPSGDTNAKLKEINVGEIKKEVFEISKIFQMLTLKNLVGKNQSIGNSFTILYFAHSFHKQLFEFKPMVDFLSDPKEQFDAVFAQWLYSDYTAGLAPLFRCPLIWFGSTEPHWQLLRLVDEIPNPSYNVDAYSTNQPPLSLSQRIWEMGTFIAKYLIINLVVAPVEKSTYEHIFSPISAKRGVSMPSYTEAVYNGSMLLLNSHPSIGASFRLPQNVKYVAGFHVDTKVKALPKDLQKLMDDAKNGVIYFSMGTNIKSSDMSDVMRDSLLEMFGKLKQTVIWKFEIDLPKLPTNVHIVKWAPQQTIFSHPNLKLFITHGGQLSITEAVHFGIPIIGIPVIADQYTNMKLVSAKGFGITVTLTEDLAVNLNTAIREILSNPSYKAKAKELSMWFNNRLKTPGEELVHWIEYTVATRGAPHLRSQALDIPCYQKLHLDVIAIFTATITMLVILVRRLYRWFKSILGKKEKTH